MPRPTPSDTRPSRGDPLYHGTDRRPEIDCQEPCCHGIVGLNPALRAAVRFARMAADDGDCTVLVTGETGTGKELIAHAIHNHGRRTAGPFSAVNAATLPHQLADSLLFGHRRGSFTDASISTQGIFETADGGTVFLDEVQELDLRVQAKLLRFLQDRRVMPLGGRQAVTVDVRIVAGSNQDLPDAVKSGRFRADLYYRLNVLPIHLPPLRARKEDIPLLIDHFLAQFNEEKRRQVTIEPQVLDALMAHDWPGNIRELRNLIERAVVVSRDGIVRPEDLPLPGAASPPCTQPCAPLHTSNLKEAKKQMIAAFERDFIYRHWRENDWHVTRTAEAIGESREWLGRLIRKYQLRPGNPP